MKKKKVLLILAFIILLIIITILINTIRKYTIITELQKNISQYSKSTNYYIKTDSLASNKTTSVMEYYKKDNKQMIKIQKRENDETVVTLMYDNGNEVNVYKETENEKIANLDSKINIDVNLYNQLECASKWKTFWSSMTAHVENITYNSKDCYLIENFMSESSLGEKAKLYIEKDTGLLIRCITENEEQNKSYVFGEVDNDIFVEPDLSQYDIEK